MSLAHRRERLGAGPRARTGQGVQGSERQLRLGAGELLLAAGPGVPAGKGAIEPRRLDVVGEQEQLETVGEGHLGSPAAIVQANMKLRRSRARLN